MAEFISHFAVKSIGLSRLNGRKPCTLLEAARHNLREIQAELGALGHIDSKLTRSNVVLAGPGTAAEVDVQAKVLLAELEVKKFRSDHCQAIESIFSLPPRSTIDPGSYFSQCLHWLTATLQLPILSAVVHHDEAAIHMHVLLLPVKNGCHVGGSPIARLELKQLREKFFVEVAGPAGLKRDGAKVRGTAKQWAVSAVLSACEAAGLPAANGPLWSVLEAAIRHDPTAAMQAMNIDVNTIRHTEKPTSKALQAVPIELVKNPIGFQRDGKKMQSLSCVGIRQPTAPKAAPLNLLRATQQYADDRSVSESSLTPALLTDVRVSEEGLIRERYSYLYNPSTWDAKRHQILHLQAQMVRPLAVPDPYDRTRERGLK